MNYIERRMKDAKVNYMAAAPETFQALVKLSEYVTGVGLDKKLMELVKTRTSQINGCAFCIEMHTRDARAAGEAEERLYLLPAWRESDHFTQRERAALAWTEALTTLDDHAAVDAAREEARVHFTDEEIVNMTVLLGATNIWNRLNIGFQLTPSNEKSKAA